jgi:cytoskeleton protein RodZ
MADRSQSILHHEDQLDLLSRSGLTTPADPVPAAKRVGQELRAARECHGTQLGDVARALNIHPNYLLAIEDGRFEDLPGPAFTIGYVARYARHLGLDVENVVDRFGAQIASRYGTFDEPLKVAPMPERNWRVVPIAAVLLLVFALTYSRDDIVAWVTSGNPARQVVDAPTPAPADEPAPIAALEPSVPPPARIAVTPSVSLRSDLTPAAIEQARIAAIPLPVRIAVSPPASLRPDLTPAAIEEARIAAIPLPAQIAVSPPASLRADLTPAAIRQETRVAALFPMPLPTRIAVTSPASLRADLEPTSIREQIRIARIPLPAQISVTPLASLRADLMPEAIERARIAAIPLPAAIEVTQPASLRADLTPEGIEEARIAAIPLPTGVAVTPPASLRADLTPAAIRYETRVAALFPMPLPTQIAVTAQASLRADLEPASIQEEMRIAALPLPTGIAVPPSVSLRADLAPAVQTELPAGRRHGLQNTDSRITLRMHGTTFVAVRDARGRIFLERRLARGDTYRVPNRVGLRLTARDGGAVEIVLDGESFGFAGSRGRQASGLSLNPQAIVDRAGQAQAVVAQAPPAAAPPRPTRISATPPSSLRADRAESAQAQLQSGNQLGLGNRGSRITLRVHRPTFVAVRDARSRIFLERRLAPGDTYRVPNRANLRLTARDGGAVEIILDGDSLGFAGSRGLQTNGLALNPQTIADRLRRF